MGLFLPGGNVLGGIIGGLTSALTGGNKGSGGSGTGGESRPTSGGSSTPTSQGGGSSGYQPYVQGQNAQLDGLIKEQSDRYFTAKAAGDAAGMREANDRANQLRNQYGYAAQFANEDINKVFAQSQGYGGAASYAPPQAQQQGENLYAKLLEEQQRQYAEIQAQQEAAKRAAVEQAVGQLAGQKTGVEQSYADLYRQLYLDRRMAEKNLPQQMAAMGYNGGLTESSALGLQTNYADALRQGEISKQGALSGIDQAITDARLTGDISIAEQAAQTAKDRLASYGDVISAMQSQQNWADQFGYQQTVDDRNYNYQTGRDQVADQRYEDETAYQKQQDALKWAYQKDSDAYDRALTKWQLTGILDAESAQVLGLPVGTRTTDYAYQLAQIAKMNAAGRSGGDGDSGENDRGPEKEPDPVKTPELTVDTGSVLELGYGPLSAEQVAKLEHEGKIESYIEGNKIRYRRIGNPPAGGYQSLIDQFN